MTLGSEVSKVKVPRPSWPNCPSPKVYTAFSERGEANTRKGFQRYRYRHHYVWKNGDIPSSQFNELFLWATLGTYRKVIFQLNLLRLRNDVVIDSMTWIFIWFKCLAKCVCFRGKHIYFFSIGPSLTGTILLKSYTH